MASACVLDEQVIDRDQPQTKPETNRRSIRPVFWIFLALYICTWGGHYTSGDGAHKIRWAKQILAGGPYWTDTVTGLPPKYGIGHTLIAIPPLLAADIIRKTTGIPAEAPLYTFIFILNGALLPYLISRYLLNRGYSTARACTIAGVAALATFWWPYTKADSTESLVAVLILASIVLLLEERAFWGFTCASMAILFRSDAIPLMFLVIAWEMRRNRFQVKLRNILLGTIPAMLIYVFVNVMRFHTIWDAGYPGEHFSNPIWVGLYGILFSAGKSVFLFSPALVLGFAGWRKFRSKFPDDALLFAAVFVLQLMIYSRWWDWSGEDSWGVRFMLPSVMLMTICCAEMLQRRVLTAAVVGIGILVQIPAVMVPSLEYLLIVHNHPLTRKALYVDGTDRIDIEDVRFDPRYSQMTAQFALLRLRLEGAPPSTPEGIQAQTGTPVTDALAQVPVQGGCRWDLIWCHLKRSSR